MWCSSDSPQEECIKPAGSVGARVSSPSSCLPLLQTLLLIQAVCQHGVSRCSVSEVLCFARIVFAVHHALCAATALWQGVWLDAAGKMTTRGEQVLWQQQYLNCCAELGQWDVINEYARGTENYAAYMDVAWKCSDWQGLKDWVLPKGAVEDTPRVSMVKACVLLQDADVTQANLHTENAITQTLHRWVC